MKYKGFKSTLRKAVALYLTTGFLAIVPQVGNAAAELPVIDNAYGSTVATSGNTMTVTGADTNNMLTWKDFSIGAGKEVAFADNKNYLNIVTGSNMSEIYGKMSGGGDIYLINPNGIIFGAGAEVNVGSLHASTRAVDMEAAKNFATTGASPITGAAAGVGNIVNMGTITANKVSLEGLNLNFRNEESINSGDVTVNASAGGKIVVGHEIGESTPREVAAGWKSNMRAASATNINDADGFMSIKAGLGGAYQLTTNVTLSDGQYINDTFTGSLDGNNNKITMGKLSVNDIKDYGNGYGLFQKLDHATISNLKLAGGTVEAKTAAGLLAGTAEGATISNVTVESGSVTSMADAWGCAWDAGVGGLIGGITGTDKTTISNVKIGSGVTVTAQGWKKDPNADPEANWNNCQAEHDPCWGHNANNAGGIVGAATNVDILGSTSNASITGSAGTGVGGIAGSVGSGSLIKGNTYQGNFDPGNAGKVGGIVGIATGATVDTNYAKFNAKGQAWGHDGEGYDVQAFGGIVGYADGSTIANCGNTNELEGRTVGGIVGYAKNSTIKDVYNSGNIVNGGMNGGIAGVLNKSSVTDAYNTGNITGWDKAGGIVGGMYDHSSISKVFSTGSANEGICATWWSDHWDDTSTIDKATTFGTKGTYTGKDSQNWMFDKYIDAGSSVSKADLVAAGFSFVDKYGDDPTGKHWVELNGKVALIGGFRDTVTATGTYDGGTYDGSKKVGDYTDFTFTGKLGNEVDVSSYVTINGQKNVTNEGGNISYKGGQDGYYIIDGTIVNITAKDIKIDKLMKESDGTTDVNGKDVTFSGKVGNDSIELTFDSAVLDGSDVGTHNITYTNVALGGADKANYVIVNPDGSEYTGGDYVGIAEIYEKADPSEHLGEVERQSYLDTVGSVQSDSSSTTSESKSNVVVVEAGTAEIGDPAAEQIVEIDGNAFELSAQTETDTASQNTGSTEVTGNTESGNNESSDNTNSDKEDEDDEEK